MGFPAVPQPVSRASTYGGLDEEEARLLLHLGLIEEKPGRPFRDPEKASDQAVLRFLERHGEWWFRLRLENKMDAIARRIACRSARRRRCRRCR